MNKLAIIGASGHGKVVADAALSSLEWQEVVFFDDAYPHCKFLENWSVLGDTDTLIENHSLYGGIIVAIGNNVVRLQILRRLYEEGCNVVSIIHSSATLSPFADIGKGTVIMAGAVVNAYSSLGIGCVINTNAVVEHDCRLGDGVHISPGSVLAGNVCVGDRSWIGAGSCVRQQITIHNDVIVGIGGVVVQELTEEGTYVGNPVFKLK